MECYDRFLQCVKKCFHQHLHDVRITLPDMCSFFGFFRVHLMTDGVNKKSWDRIIIDSTNPQRGCEVAKLALCGEDVKTAAVPPDEVPLPGRYARGESSPGSRLCALRTGLFPLGDEPLTVTTSKRSIYL